METEIPEMVRRAGADPVSFHSSRMRMRQVSPEELRAMDAQAVRCIDELADAHVHAIAYACLVAVMVQGPGAHRVVEGRVQGPLAADGSDAPVISSAGALISTLGRLNADRVALVAPYLKPLTQTVAEYIEAEGIAV